MKFRNGIFVCFIVLSSSSFSQTTFSTIDSLLARTFIAVDHKDTAEYLSILNRTIVFNAKHVKTKSDSLAVLKSYSDTFLETTEKLREMVLTPEVSVMYSGYQTFAKNVDLAKVSGKIRLKVDLVLNDSFLVKLVMDITGEKGLYWLDAPLYGMFVVEGD